MVFREYMGQVFRGLVLHANLEHQGCEEVAAGLLHVYLNTADYAHFDVGDLCHYPLDIVLRDLVHGVAQLGHGLVSRVDLLVVWLERLSDVHRLVVESVGARGHSHLVVLAFLLLPIVFLQPLEGIDSRAASMVIEVLPVASELAKLPIRGDADVRSELDDKVAISWHMGGESTESYLADKRNTGKAAHVETFAGHAAQPVVQTVGVVVDLVGANAAGEERISRSAAFLEQSKVDSLVELHGELGGGVVLRYLLHGLLLDARVEGHLHLALSAI